MDAISIILAIFSLIYTSVGQSPASWEDVWGYHKLQGPDAWGELHSAWKMCKDGHRQSPIDVKADYLLFDHRLNRLELQAPSSPIFGNYTNTGRAVVFTPDPSFSVLIHSGPLDYRYKLYEIRLHFGEANSRGSEHQIEGLSFQGEMQMLFWNQDIYNNFESARDSPNGLAAIAIFIQLNTTTSKELLKLVDTAIISNLVYKSSTVEVRALSIAELMPSTMEYITYEGSITIPPCVESVTWILFNRALYISSYHLSGLRELLRTKYDSNPPERLFHNYRPPQPLNSRVVRTNIDHTVDIHKKCNQTRREYTYTVKRFADFL